MSLNVSSRFKSALGPIIIVSIIALAFSGFFTYLTYSARASCDINCDVNDCGRAYACDYKGAYGCDHERTATTMPCDNCCNEGYTEFYRCIGNDRQRLWQFSDCNREWRSVETCSYGCSDGSCLKCPTALLDASVTPINDVFEGENIHATIRLYNNADQGRYFYVEAYLCRSSFDCTQSHCTSDYSNFDYSNFDCNRMSCTDSIVYVPAGSTEYVECSRFSGTSGRYVVKVTYSTDSTSSSVSTIGCDKPFVYSNVFSAFDRFCKDGYCRTECGAGYYGTGCETCKAGGYKAGDYRCFGNYRQRSYLENVEGKCELRWEVVEYCPYGCESGACTQPKKPETQPKVGEPEVFMSPKYNLDSCKPSSIEFSIKNNGEADSFDIKASGEAADWVSVAPIVSVDKDETKSVTAFISVPCDAAPGEHDFTITASGKTTDIRSGIINVREQGGIFSISPATDLLILAVVAAVFVAAFLARRMIQGGGSIALGTRFRSVGFKSVRSRTDRRRCGCGDEHF